MHHPFGHLEIPGRNICMNHYGHKLVDALFPAFRGLSRWGSASHKENILFDSCRESEQYLPLWETVSGRGRPPLSLLNPPFSTARMVTCFRRLITGPAMTGLYGQDIDDGDFERFRDHVVTAIGLPLPSHNERLAICIVNRLSSRRLLNLDSLVSLLQNANAPATWPMSIRVVYLEQLDPLKQVAFIYSCNILIGVIGSGMHQALWLPPGSVVVDIMHPYHEYANVYICQRFRSIFCTVSEGAVAVSRNGSAVPASVTGPDGSLDLIADPLSLLRALTSGLAWMVTNRMRHLRE